jgi:isochorismate synthase
MFSQFPTTIPTDIPKYDVNFLELILKNATLLGLPIAVWRLPVQKEGGNRHIVVDFSGKASLIPAELEHLPAGFVVSPFVQEQEKIHFIRADFHYQSQENTYTIRKNTYPIANKFLQAIASKNQNLSTKSIQKTTNVQQTSKENKNQHTSEEKKIEIEKKVAFETMVAQAIQAMQEGKFQKVVLSRTKHIALTQSFSLAKTFEQLCVLYPHAFISLVSANEFGTWLGASPEIMISFDKEQIFRTVALAGTQAKGDNTNLQEAMWRQKEIEEQALVSRYIINCFKKVRVREFEEDGPKTVVAGNLLHLRTDFEVDTKAINFPELPTVMLNLLHPTSAVCGMPKPEALDFIVSNEIHSRKLYAGYLGQVNIAQETHLFVNLRCMEIVGQETILYAGGGITKDSVPEREWIETELKCKTVAQALN